jgi:hypothetical protein
VAKVIEKRGGVFTREFLRLEGHYLFAHHFCLVRRPMEKGHTETLVGFARRNFLVPVPEFDDFEAFNEGLVDDCRRDLQRQLRGKKRTRDSELAWQGSTRLDSKDCGGSGNIAQRSSSKSSAFVPFFPRS